MLSVQVTQERCAELETEAVVLNDELTRTSAVAARAVAREVVNGSKDEGVVPVALHLEEVGFGITPRLLLSTLLRLCITGSCRSRCTTNVAALRDVQACTRSAALPMNSGWLIQCGMHAGAQIQM